MLARTFFALLLVLTACPKPPMESGPGPGTPAGSGAGSGTGSAGSAGSATGGGEASATAPKLGQPCGAADACGEGSCVTYYGIAGPRGPAFKSCEIRCDAQGACADGRKCVTVADGPGAVCRDPDPIR